MLIILTLVGLAYHLRWCLYFVAMTYACLHSLSAYSEVLLCSFYC